MQTVLKHACTLLLLFISFNGTTQEYEWPNDPVKIVVLGSSTAAGTRLSDKSKSWVGLYSDYLKSFNPSNEIVNLAIGGFCTYHVMPNDFKAPLKRQVCDTNANISRALALGCNGIIVNLPSNDVDFNYRTNEVLKNFRSLATVAQEREIPIWFTTSQPRNFNRHDQRSRQLILYDSLRALFPNNNFDFWTGIADASHGVKPEYDSGDGVHLNYAGHKILADRVITSNAFDSILQKSAVKVPVKVIPPRSPYEVNVTFNGKLTVETPYLADGVTIELIQLDSVLSTQTIDSRIYGINGDPDIRYPFYLRFSGEEILTKKVEFDFQSIPTEYSILAPGSFIPIESLDMVIVPLKDLGELPEEGEISVARFAYKETNHFYLLMPDQDFIRVQREHMSYYYKPIKKGKVKRYDDDKVLLGKFSYKNGKLDGKCTWFYRDGTKMIEAQFHNGVYDGDYLIYWENGKPRERHFYEKGELVGTAIRYEENDPKPTGQF